MRPVEEVARYLAGGRPVDVVQPPSTKEWDLKVVVPVPDMAELGQPTGDLSGAAAGPEQRASIWPHVEERIVDLVAEHTSTLVFSNCRRLAERLTTRLNEIWEERVEAAEGADTVGAPDAVPRPAALTRSPAQVMAQAGAARGAPAVLARAHHGSVSKEQRATIEDDLKSGRLPAVVATSSLELGIDMGAVDLVVQVESPPSVASGLQRVGRAGHQVGAVEPRRALPQVPRRPRADRRRSSSACGPAQIEALHLPHNPLDVLAQQVVAMCALDDWTVDDVLALVRRSASYSDAHPAGARVGARHAGRALPVRRVRRAAAPPRLGPRRRHPHRPPRRPAPRGHLGRHDPRPRAVRRVPRPARGPDAGSASSTRRWSTSRGSAT